MVENKEYTSQEWHRKVAAESFNLVWELLDKQDRTKEEEDQMVHAAHASRFHWGEIGTALEKERGEWQISRVYSVLGRGQSALYHANRCLEICKENEIGDFDLAFAYEAMGRAYAVLNDQKECEKYIQLAKDAGEKIEDKDNRDYFFSELKAINV